MWQVYAFLSAFFAALVAIFAKIGLKAVDPIAGTAIRSIIMAAVVLFAAIALHRFKTTPVSMIGVKDWILISMAGIAGAASWIFYFMALKTGEAAKVSAIDRTSLVFIVILAALFLGEAFTWKSALGIVFIMIGVVIMSFI